MFQGGGQDLAIARVIRGFQIVNNANAGQHQALTLFQAFCFHGIKGHSSGCGTPGFR